MFLIERDKRDGLSDVEEKVPGFKKRDRHCLIKCLSSGTSIFFVLFFCVLVVKLILDEIINFLGLHVFKANILS